MELLELLVTEVGELPPVEGLHLVGGTLEHGPAECGRPDAHHPAISRRSRALEQAGRLEAGDEPADVRSSGHEPVGDRTQGDPLLVFVETGDPQDRVLAAVSPWARHTASSSPASRWLSSSTRRYVSRPTQSRRGSPPLMPLAPAPG